MDFRSPGPGFRFHGQGFDGNALTASELFRAEGSGIVLQTLNPKSETPNPRLRVEVLGL